jgi:hypothetical protein
VRGQEELDWSDRVPGKRTQLSLLALSLAAWVVCASPVRGDFPIRKSIEIAAERLTSMQRTRGLSAGSWPEEEMSTGPIVAGLADAYALTCIDDFRTAAQAGGNYILHLSSDNFYGDEAYALACLCGILPDDRDNPWQSALRDFYVKVRHRPNGGTQGYINLLSSQSEMSEMVCHMAGYTIAAFSIDAHDKSIWREGLIDCLGWIDDSTAVHPVRALGAAVWALACTGPLDDSAIDPCDDRLFCWHGKTLADLPGMLLEHWIAEGDLAGSFYKRFDHGNGGVGPVAGYTEDTVFGALGLAAARRILEDPAIEIAAVRTRDVLLSCIGKEGEVYRYMWLDGEERCLYSAEVIQAIAALTNPADLDFQGRVDAADLAILAGVWRFQNGRDRCSCGRADINRDGQVDERDLMVMARQWLRL